MWKTVRIRQREYEFVRELAKKQKKSMCEVVSEAVSEYVRGMAAGVLRAALSVLIAELDEIIRNPTLSAERKIEKIEALLYGWVVGNKLPIWEVRRENGFVMMEVSENVGEVVDNTQREVSDNYREQDRRRN